MTEVKLVAQKRTIPVTQLEQLAKALLTQGGKQCTQLKTYPPIENVKGYLKLGARAFYDDIYLQIGQGIGMWQKTISQDKQLGWHVKLVANDVVTTMFVYPAGSDYSVFVNQVLAEFDKNVEAVQTA